MLVALGAKGYEILSGIIAETAPRLNVMDLKISVRQSPEGESRKLKALNCR